MSHLELTHQGPVVARQLADYLQIPAASLKYMRHTGDDPPGFRVGRHNRYRLADVDAWLKGRGLDVPAGRRAS